MSLIIPNLICLGPAKCGTTSLYDVCAGHPDICVSNFKEPAFFSDKDSFSKGVEWYSNKYFSNFKGEKVIGEFSPSYFTSNIALMNIKSSLDSDTKFMIVLRNPAKRSFSHYLHLKRDGLVLDPFDTLMHQLADNYSKNQVLDDKIGKIYTDSLYDVHLINYFKYFPDRSKVLILKFEEDLKDNCIGFKRKLSQFCDLELKKFPVSNEVKNGSQDVSDFIRPLKKILNTDNFFREIIRRIVPSHVRSATGFRINNFLNKRFYKESDRIDEDKIHLINKELFSVSIRHTEEILDESLIAWS